MAEHIFVPDQYLRHRPYTAKGSPVSWAAPTRDRSTHGSRLENRLREAWKSITERRDRRHAIGLPHPEGAHITFRLKKGSEQQLKSLEGLRGGLHLSKVRLRHVYNDIVDGEEFLVAVVWVPREKRGIFARMLSRYLNEETANGNPKHNNLIACVEDIRSSLLSDYWPKHEQSRIPADRADWVEAWLATERTDELNADVEEAFLATCQQLEIEVSDRRLFFPERRVLLIKANRPQLQELIESSDELSELRLARACTSFFMRDPEVDRWIDDLRDRVRSPKVDSPAVCVLDTGVNRGHRLLQPVIAPTDCLTVMKSWGVTDHHPQGHGTGMCGLAAYGPLEVPLSSADPLALSHWIESVKLLGPDGHPDTLPKDLWGQFTQRAASLIEIEQPRRQRSFCMAISAEEDMDQGLPSSWSGAIDQLTSGHLDGVRRLMLIAAGNVDDETDWKAFPDSNQTKSVQDPGQAWNALTVGAFTDKVTFDDKDGSRKGFTPVAEKGDLSPYSTTTLTWDKAWPIKPEIVCEGGNLLRSPDGRITGHDDLDCLTTAKTDSFLPLVPMFMTSAATAQAAWMSGQIQAAYPHAWPETVRGLLVHSARWTDAMLRKHRPNPTKSGYVDLLRTVGYGVPDLQRALACGQNSLTLIAQQHIQPYGKKEGGGDKTKEMHVFEMPWPRAALQALPPNARVRVRVTLSYFIEPSPQEVGWKDRYRYPSFGLRWDMMRPGERRSDLISRITTAIADEEAADEAGIDADLQSSQDSRWRIGANARSRGSLHADIWEGATAADVAACDHIAVYPTMGWWRKRSHLGSLEKQGRYSLIVTIETDDEKVDIYTPVSVQVAQTIRPDIVT